MFGCRRCCGVFRLVDERCASQSPKSRRVRRTINSALRSLSEFSEPAVAVSEAAGAGTAALRLTIEVFSVFPLRPRDKRPLPYFNQWEKRVTQDPNRVYQWWVNAPYNIGVATGPSQLLVIDCETAPGNARQRPVGLAPCRH
jgi:hypothetical protein